MNTFLLIVALAAASLLVAAPLAAQGPAPDAVTGCCDPCPEGCCDGPCVCTPESCLCACCKACPVDCCELCRCEPGPEQG